MISIFFGSRGNFLNRSTMSMAEFSSLEVFVLGECNFRISLLLLRASFSLKSVLVIRTRCALPSFTFSAFYAPPLHFGLTKLPLLIYLPAYSFLYADKINEFIENGNPFTRICVSFWDFSQDVIHIYEWRRMMNGIKEAVSNSNKLSTVR